MFLDRIFKKTVSKDVVNPNIFIDILDYDDLDDYSKALVDKYKEEYMTLFKIISSTSELDKDLISEIKMYQELVLNVLFKDTFGDLLESKVASIKLNIYSNKYEEINRILKLKYIALQEIKKDKKYLSIYNRLYLRAKYKININQVISYYENTLYNLIATVNDKIFKCVSTSLLNNPKIDLYEEELIKRYNEVNNDYKLIFNREIPILDNISESIAYAEIELEKYVLLNKSKLNDYNSRLLEISSNDIKDIDERDNIINELINIRNDYYIINKYGRNIVKQEEFEELYLVIFNVYTYFPNSINKFSHYYVFGAFTDEIKYYENIVREKMDLLRNRKSVIFTGERKYSDKLVNVLLKELENDSFIGDSGEEIRGCFEYNIITDNLDLLLALDYHDGLDNYINSRVDKYTFDSSFDRLKYLLALSIYYKESYYNKPIEIAQCSKELKLYSLLTNDLNFNILPTFNNNLFNEDMWINYLKLCSDKPIYLYDGIKDVVLNADEEMGEAKKSNIKLRTYVLPDSACKVVFKRCKNKDANPFTKRVVVPSSHEVNIEVTPKFNTKRRMVKEWNDEFDNITRSIVFDEGIFNMSSDELKAYFKSIYSYLFDLTKEYIDAGDYVYSCKFHTYYGPHLGQYYEGSFHKRVYDSLINNISFMNSNGEIKKVFDVVRLQESKKTILDFVSLDYVFDLIVSSINMNNKILTKR